MTEFLSQDEKESLILFLKNKFEAKKKQKELERKEMYARARENILRFLK